MREMQADRESGRRNRTIFTLIEGRIYLVILLLIGLITISGCIKGGLDSQTQQILQNAIDELDRQPGLWQNTMTSTIDELGRVSTSSAKEVLAEVQSTYNGALGQTESTAFCGADFIGHRLEQRLQAILHKFNNSAPAPTIIPVICSTNPTDHVDARTTRLVTYYGYDFLEFSKNQTFTADLQYASGQILKQNFGFVAIPHNYELTIDIQAANYANVDRTKGPQLVLKWGGQNVAGEGAQSALPILLPPPSPTPTPIPPKTTLNFPTITPVVNTGDVINYPISFQQGDVVTVVVGGCVQTGGSGKTWKRYVNPSGSDSDRLYFGKINIPGITNGFTPIRDLVGFGSYDSNSPDKLTLTFTIPNIDTIRESDRHLALQYVDDGYSDNGYYSHDDGTEDQCKNVGNAFVTITIKR